MKTRQTRQRKTRQTRQRQRKTRRKRGGSKKSSSNSSIKLLSCGAKGRNVNAPSSCYDDKQLVELAKLYNAKHSKQGNPISTENPSQIWNELKSRYLGECKNEACWAKDLHGGSESEKSKKISAYFAPKAPSIWKKKPNEWLNSLDIIRVTDQYEREFKTFDFIDVSPIDYDAREEGTNSVVSPKLANFNLKQEITKHHKDKFGVIFNLDTHDKGGSHWVSLFINVKLGKIYYFDSVGDPCPPGILKFVEKVTKQGETLNPPIHFRLDQNIVAHQKGNTECGVYSLFFIIQMLKGRFFYRHFKKDRVSDKEIEKFRKVFFNDADAF